MKSLVITLSALVALVAAAPADAVNQYTPTVFTFGDANTHTMCIITNVSTTDKTAHALLFDNEGSKIGDLGSILVVGRTAQVGADATGGGFRFCKFNLGGTTAAPWRTSICVVQNASHPDVCLPGN